MDTHQAPDLSHLMDDPNFDPEQLGAWFWYEQFLSQRAANQQQQDIQQQQQEIQRLRHQLNQLQTEVNQLREALCKLSDRNSNNSSQPPSADIYKKKNKIGTESERTKRFYCGCFRIE